MRDAVARRERLLQVLGLWLLVLVAAFYAFILAGGSHRGGDLYDLVVAGQAGVSHGWITLYYRTGWAVIRTLPLVEWLYLPLGAVTLGTAYLIWTALMLACAVAAWWLCAPGKGLPRLLWLAALIASFPFVYGVGVGQVVPVALLLLAAADRLLERRPSLAGGALALALQVKPTLAFLAVPALAAAREYRAALVAVIVSGAFLALYFALMGPGFAGAYAHATGGFLAHQEGFAIPNSLGLTVTYGLRLLVAAVAMLFAWRRRAARFALAVGVAGSLLASPYVHPHDLLVIFLAAWALHREAGGRAAALAFAPLMVAWTLAAQAPEVVIAAEAYFLACLCWAALRTTEPARAPQYTTVPSHP